MHLVLPLVSNASKFVPASIDGKGTGHSFLDKSGTLSRTKNLVPILFRDNQASLKFKSLINHISTDAEWGKVLDTTKE